MVPLRSLSSITVASYALHTRTAAASMRRPILTCGVIDHTSSRLMPLKWGRRQCRVASYVVGTSMRMRTHQRCEGLQIRWVSVHIGCGLRAEAAHPLPAFKSGRTPSPLARYASSRRLHPSSPASASSLFEQRAAVTQDGEHAGTRVPLPRISRGCQSTDLLPVSQTVVVFLRTTLAGPRETCNRTRASAFHLLADYSGPASVARRSATVRQCIALRRKCSHLPSMPGTRAARAGGDLGLEGSGRGGYVRPRVVDMYAHPPRHAGHKRGHRMGDVGGGVPHLHVWPMVLVPSRHTASRLSDIPPPLWQRLPFDRMCTGLGAQVRPVV